MARTSESKATMPARSPSRVATAVSIITASMACSSRGTPATSPAMVRPASSSSRTVWLRSARYVRTIGLFARAVAAQSMRRAEADLQDPGLVDAQLRLVLGMEGRVDTQHALEPPAPLAGDQAEWAVDSHHDLGRAEAPAPLRSDGGGRARTAAGCQHDPGAPCHRGEGGGQLVRQPNP